MVLCQAISDAYLVLYMVTSEFIEPDVAKHIGKLWNDVVCRNYTVKALKTMYSHLQALSQFLHTCDAIHCLLVVGNAQYFIFCLIRNKKSRDKLRKIYKEG